VVTMSGSQTDTVSMVVDSIIWLSVRQIHCIPFLAPYRCQERIYRCLPPPGSSLAGVRVRARREHAIQQPLSQRGLCVFQSYLPARQHSGHDARSERTLR